MVDHIIYFIFLALQSDDGSDDGKTRVTATTRKTVAKKKRSTEVHKLSERVSL